MIKWYVEGVQFGTCSCVYACPCQFEGKPTEGGCRGFEVVHIDKGHFGDTDLSGLKIALFYAWPGPVYEGKGEMQAVVDESANDDQRDALLKILYGEETEEATTHWWVYRAMSDTVHEPLYRPIEMEVDIEARTAKVSIPDVVRSTGRPITSPVDGAEHRVRIDIPNGIEFELAEIGAADSKAAGAIAFDLSGTYGQFNVLRHSGTGVVR